MDNKVQVDRKNKHCSFEARDKDLLMQQIIHMHDQGFSQVDIAKNLGISRGTILRWNKELKFFPPRLPGEAGKLKSKIYYYDENFFKVMDDPNKAYILGFIMGDGCVHDRQKSMRLVITLAIQDKQILEDIAEYLAVSEILKIRKSKKRNEQDKISLVLNSTTMCKDLSKYGINPNKTGKETFPNLNDISYQWAFLRGLFDADGHIRKHLRGNHLKAKFSLTSNKDILLQVKKFFETEGIETTPNCIYKKEGCYSLDLGSVKTIQKIYLKLYGKETGTLNLNRKHGVFKSLMI